MSCHCVFGKTFILILFKKNNLRFETVRRTTHGDVDISVTRVGACDKNMDALFLTEKNHSPGPWKKRHHNINLLL